MTLAGETVLHDPRSDRYVRLNPTAAFLWAELEVPRSLSDLAACLVGRYGLDSGSAQRDVTVLAQELVRRGVIELQDGATDHV